MSNKLNRSNKLNSLSAQSNDLDVLREKLCEDTVTLVDAHASLSADIGSWVATLGDEGLWPDVVYTCDNLKGWQAAVHLTRLLTLAKAWYAHASAWHDDATLLAAVLQGLDGWFNAKPQNPNWWWMQIGAPLRLADVLLHVVAACDESVIARAVPAFISHQPATRFTGQNLVWVADIQIRHGVLVRDPALVSQGFTVMGRELRVFPREEGIQPDMSFFQHRLLLYAGGYGQGFAADVARLIYVADGTSYAWPAEKVALLARYLLDGCRWMVRGRTFDYGTVGREISRRGHSAARLFCGADFLAQIDSPWRAALQALAAGGDGRSLVTGNRMFWCADFMAHHRAGYAFTVRVPSTRIENADWPCCGGEGRLCHHMAEGASFLYRDGDEYRDLFPVWNWRQIPGTTVEQNPGPLDPEALRGYGASDFAGGVSDGCVGCCAVDFRRGALRARKAWFLFDAGMVALGGDIVSASAVKVRTTVNQCRDRGPVVCRGVVVAQGDHAALAPGASVSHDGLTVLVLSGDPGEVCVERRSGAWADCGVESCEVEEHAVVTIGIDHGVRPSGATYAYAVHLEGAANARAAAKVVILHNEAALQAVWHAGEARGQAVFYQAGRVSFPDGQIVTVDCPCLLLYHHEAGRAVLTLADPRQKEQLLTLGLCGRITAEVSVSLPQREYGGSSLSLSVADYILPTSRTLC